MWVTAALRFRRRRDQSSSLSLPRILNGTLQAYCRGSINRLPRAVPGGSKLDIKAGSYEQGVERVEWATGGRSTDDTDNLEALEHVSRKLKKHSLTV